MPTLHASREVTLAHLGNQVRLRASLRAAAQLHDLHGGFAELFRKVEEFHTETIRQIIQVAAVDRKAADAFQAQAATQPLQTLAEATHGPLMVFCAALLPAPSQSTSAAIGKLMAWPDAFAELYRIATGWLGWTPETAWNSHPDEITAALDGHVQKLTLMNGGPSSET